MPETIDAVFAQLRKDVEAATSPEHRQVAVDKAELAVKSIVIRLLSRDSTAAPGASSLRPRQDQATGQLSVEVCRMTEKDLSRLGLEPGTQLDFRREQINKGQSFQIFFRSAPPGISVRPRYAETELGVFKCGCPGGARPNGEPVVRSLGCPVHTPSQSWPITNALVAWAGKWRQDN